MSPTAPLLLTAALLLAQQTPAVPMRHDFRGGRAAPPWLKVVGPDARAVIQTEEGGLRVKPPPAGKQSKGWGVGTSPKTFSLLGDFQITGGFELLTADPPPTRNPGAGIALSVAPDGQRTKFAKVGRFLRAAEGSTYLAESFVKGQPETYRLKWQPTDSRAGRLRLERRGATLRCLVADGAGDDFRPIDEFEFGTDPIGEVYFIANNNMNDTALDVRLTDLSIRQDRLPAAPDATPADAGQPAADPPEGRSLVLLLLAGLALVALVALGVGAMLLRRRGTVSKRIGPASLTCPGCGKEIKVRAELAGKNVKCPQCGRVFHVPGSLAQ